MALNPNSTFTNRNLVVLLLSTTFGACIRGWALWTFMEFLLGTSTSSSIWGKTLQPLAVRILQITFPSIFHPLQLLCETASILESNMEDDDGSPFCHLSLLAQKHRITHLWLFLLALVPPLRSLTEINAAVVEHSLMATLLYNMQC